jgi:flagellar protein FliO/FliZ
MAQRLDAALSRPTDEKLRLSLSDLLEDIEGTAADVSAPPAAPADRPRVPLATRRPAPPRAEPKSRAGLNPADYSRFLSEDPASAPSPAGSGEAAARTQARELFSDGWMRATRRLDRTDEPALKAPDVNVRPSRAAEPPAAPTPREPLLTARRSDAAPPLNAASKRDPAPAVTKDAAPAPKPELDDPVAFLDEFDAEMATLLGRTPPR